jgi:hypothetical protein
MNRHNTFPWTNKAQISPLHKKFGFREGAEAGLQIAISRLSECYHICAVPKSPIRKSVAKLCRFSQIFHEIAYLFCIRIASCAGAAIALCFPSENKGVFPSGRC